MTRDDADDFISEHGLAAAKDRIGWGERRPAVRPEPKPITSPQLDEALAQIERLFPRRGA